MHPRDRPSVRDRPHAKDVRAVYERIGPHFAETRAHPWDEVDSFVADAAQCDVGLDIGCGNGRHTALLADKASEVLAVDVAWTLLETARARAETDDWSATFVCGDAVRLPITADCVDLAIYVAAIHHLGTQTARRRSLDELARVLAPDGRALISAWSVTHDRFDVDSNRTTGMDTTVDWTLPDGTTVPRYYHIYAPAEFENDLAASDIVIERTFVSGGNCYAVVHP